MSHLLISLKALSCKNYSGNQTVKGYVSVSSGENGLEAATFQKGV